MWRNEKEFPQVATLSAKKPFSKKAHTQDPFHFRYQKQQSGGYYKRVEDDEFTTSEGGQPRDMRSEICDEAQIPYMVQSDGDAIVPETIWKLRAGYLI